MDTPDNINQLIQLYVRHQATPEQRHIVREYIMDDVKRFDLLLERMRNEAMRKINLEIEDDFLPDVLRNCAPQVYADSPAFRDSSVSAQLPPVTPKSAYDILHTLLYPED